MTNIEFVNKEIEKIREFFDDYEKEILCLRTKKDFEFWENRLKMFEQIKCELEDYYKIKDLVYKETPKKVIGENICYDQYKNENMYAISCPNCGEQLLYFKDSDFIEETFDLFLKHYEQHIDTSNWKYCGYCGQKLDWSDETIDKREEEEKI